MEWNVEITKIIIRNRRKHVDFFLTDNSIKSKMSTISCNLQEFTADITKLNLFVLLAIFTYTNKGIPRIDRPNFILSKCDKVHWYSCSIHRTHSFIDYGSRQNLNSLVIRMNNKRKAFIRVHLNLDLISFSEFILIHEGTDVISQISLHSLHEIIVRYENISRIAP